MSTTSFDPIPPSGTSATGASGVSSKCCWCGNGFVRVGPFFWCTTEACRERQAERSIGLQNPTTGEFVYLYVPLPKQVEFDACTARCMLGGGAAGSTKSHAARWGLYRRSLAIPDYESLILRRTWNELEKHHLRLMEKEAVVFRGFGIDVKYSRDRREMTWPNGSIIEGGHMENPDDVDKYLSRERDEIDADEGSTFPPRQLFELSTRARSAKPAVIAAGGARFRVYSNPGGPASMLLRDFFIDHEPRWDDFAPELKALYDPNEWVYIPGNLEDNPYLPARYEADLALAPPWRFKQLRYNDWDSIAGQFFTDFNPVEGKLHVQDLGDPGGSVQWFRSLDWGYVQPGCVLWWACLPDGVYYIRYEFKFSHSLIEDVAEEIIKRTKDYGIHNIRYTAADPSLTQTNAGKRTGESMEETFMDAGVSLLMSINDRVNGWQRVREFFGLREDGRPSIIIHPSCRYLIRSLTDAVSAKHDPEDVDTTIDDHALDALRYGAMSRPSPTRRSFSYSQKSFYAKQKNLLSFRRKMSVR